MCSVKILESEDLPNQQGGSESSLTKRVSWTKSFLGSKSFLITRLLNAFTGESG